MKQDLPIFLMVSLSPSGHIQQTVSEIRVDHIFYALLCVIILLYKIQCYISTLLIIIKLNHQPAFSSS